MRKVFKAAFVALTLSLFLVPVFASNYLTNGDFQTGSWSPWVNVTYNGGTASIITDGTYVAYFQSTDTQRAYAYQTMSSSVSSGTGIFQFDVKILQYASNGHGPAAQVTNAVSSPLNVILILMDSSSVREQFAGCSVQTVMSSGLSSGWHTIKATIDYSAGKATIYVDGAQKLQTSCTSIPAMYVAWIGQPDLNGSGTVARKSEFDNVYSGT